MKDARPGPLDPAPMPGFPRVGFQAAFAAGPPNVAVGRCSHHDDPAGPERFFDENALHHSKLVGDRLVFGPFWPWRPACAFG